MIDFSKHYWIVAGSTVSVYSSSVNRYVDVADSGYLAWLGTGRVPTSIADEKELWTVLQQRLPGELPEWMFDGTSFVPNAAGLTASQLTAYAKLKRWQKHTGGAVIGEIPILTDAESKLMITGARIAANADPDWSTVWDGADGGCYPVTAAEMIAISDGLQTFVNQCFSVYAAVKAAIDNGDITRITEIDAAFAA